MAAFKTETNNYPHKLNYKLRLLIWHLKDRNDLEEPKKMKTF